MKECTPWPTAPLPTLWILSTFLMLSHTIFSFTHHPAGTCTDFSLPQKHQTVFHLRAFACVLLSTCNFIPSALCSVSLFRSLFKCPLSVRSLLAFYQKLPLQDIWYHNLIISLLEFFTICNYFVCMCMYFAIFCLLPLDFKIFEKTLSILRTAVPKVATGPGMQLTLNKYLLNE